MDLNTFGDSTPYEFSCFVAGFERQITDQARMSWEQARWQVLWLVNIQLDRKNRIKKLTDLIRFSWDEEVKSELPDMDKIKKLKTLINRYEAK